MANSSQGFDWRALLGALSGQSQTPVASQTAPANAATPAVVGDAGTAGILPAQDTQTAQQPRGLNGALNFAENLGSDVKGALGLGSPSSASGGGFMKAIGALFGI